MEFIATFGHGQFGGVMKNAYIHFKNATNIQARRWMVKHFDGKWSGTYACDTLADDGWKYIDQYQPTKLATVTFGAPGDGEFDIDSYEVQS